MALSDKQKAAIFIDRFQGRSDAFGIRYESAEGKVGYRPSCDNYWKPGCHLKEKEKQIPCTQCELKAFTPVSPESVLRHIRGQEIHMIYTLKLDGNVSMAAVDFDMKPGKESKGYGFDEVIKYSNLLNELGIPNAIARSTTAGFHCYIFMTEGYSAAKIRAIMIWCFEMLGWMEQHRQGVKPIPEIFPKQTSGGVGGLGNGIRPPMTETQFRNGKNCFVDGNNEPIPYGEKNEGQWNYLDNIPKVSPAYLDQIIEDKGIEVIEGTNLAARSYSSSGIIGRTVGKWQPPLAGSIHKLLDGCVALRKISQKCADIKSGKIKDSITHAEGFTLFHLCMHVSDGLDWFKANVPGWGENPSDIRQLEHSLATNYSPHTCRKLQENGICVTGTKCFDKKAPIERIDGAEIIRADIPESEWPEPSPIRYAFGSGEVFLSSLIEEVAQLRESTDKEKTSIRVQEIIKESAVFDERQQGLIKDAIVAAGLRGKREVGADIKKANKEKVEEVKKIAEKRGDIAFGGNGQRYKKLPFGYAKYVATKEGGIDEQICDFDIEIREVITKIEGTQSREQLFKGVVRTKKSEKAFEINSIDFDDNAKFINCFRALLMNDFQVRRQDIDELRIAALRFSDVHGKIEHNVYYAVQGWYDDVYLMPSVIIDADGVRPNTTKPVSLTGKFHAEALDFKVLTDPEYMELMLHVKTDLFNTFDRGNMFSCISQAILALVSPKLGINVKPTLYLDGSTGYGKTSMAMFVQKFFGNFKGPMLWTTTFKSVLGYSYDFKDVLLLMDDYKARTFNEINAIKQTVQSSYEESFRGAKTMTGAQRSTEYARCHFIMTGEIVPENEASFIGRTILMEYPKRDNLHTKDSHQRCKEHEDNYNGILPRFIHWFLQQDRKRIKDDIFAIKNELQQSIAGKTNADRIAENCAISFVCWKLFCYFMRDTTVIDHKEADALIDEQWKFISAIRTFMQNRCSREQNGVVFAEILVEALQTGLAKIDGSNHYGGQDSNKAVSIGFMDPDDEEELVYLYPTATTKIVSSLNVANIILNQTGIGRQLMDEGVIAKHDASRTTLSKRLGGNHRRVWCMNMVKLGLTPNNVKLKIISKQEDLKTPMDKQGLI